MTEEELRKKMADVFREFHTMMNQIPPPESMGKYTYWVNRVDKVYRDAGWKGPEEIELIKGESFRQGYGRGRNSR